jgi:hypothetical protein
MKNYAVLFVPIFLLAGACNSNGQQAEAKKIADDIQKTMKATKPGMVATSINGYYMKATINGKAWQASHMYPTDKASGVAAIAGQTGAYLEKGSISITIPVNPVRRWLEVGKKYKFGEGRAVDFALDEDTYGGYTGELTITKVDEKWVEGAFYFTATSSSAPGKHEITNGSFRVEITKEN